MTMAYSKKAKRIKKQSRADCKNLTKKFDKLCGEVTTKKVSAEEMEKLFS